MEFMALWERATYALVVTLALATAEVMGRAAAVADFVEALEDA